MQNPLHLHESWISWGRIHESLNGKWQADPSGCSLFVTVSSWGQSCICETRDKTQSSKLNSLRVLYRPGVESFMCEIPDWRPAFGYPSPGLCLSHIPCFGTAFLKQNLYLVEDWLIDHINGQSWWIPLTLPIPTIVLCLWFGALCRSGSMAMFGLSGAVFRSLTGSVLYVVLWWLIWERAHNSKKSNPRMKVLFSKGDLPNCF